MSAMDVFELKLRDTFPVLEVQLLKPDRSIYDLTGSTAWHLHIRLSNGTRLTRPMFVQGDPTLGLLRYAWQVTDWDAASGTTVDGAYPVGGLVVSPGEIGPEGFVPTRGALPHMMEYEVIGPGPDGRITFPNGGFAKGGYDVLRIFPDFGQGA